MSDGFTEIQKAKKKDAYLKKRKGIRKELLIQEIKKLGKENDRLSSIEIYHHCFNNGYSYSYPTLKKDLEELVKAKIITKKVVYQGKGTGTKSLWGVVENDIEKK